MCILKGFPTSLAKSADDRFPFGLWFANATTLYVADEGDGTHLLPPRAPTPTRPRRPRRACRSGSSTATSWKLAYTLQAGLNLGTPYTVPGYPAGDNAATGLPWAPATDGLRNITGRVNPNGTATIWAITSTVSGGGAFLATPSKSPASVNSSPARRSRSMPALKRKSAPSETPVGTQPMMGQLYAHGATVGSPFQFEADRFVQRPHAFRGSSL